jgi:hypothetical protein
MTYDLYMFAPEGEVVIGWHRFDADTDEAAVDLAQGLAQQPPLELWKDDVLVRRWEKQT